MIDTNGNLVVVDVREEDEYCTIEPPTPSVSHIPGALNYPWNTGVLMDNYGELPDDKDILVVCRDGTRSAAAADFLCNREKFESTPIYNMLGGMLAWEAEGWETVGCCYSDADCDDGLYCTGQETCVDLNCQPSPGDPCVDQSYFCCDEDADTCREQEPHIDYDCDGVLDDGGDHACTPGEIEDCNDNCLDKPNGPDLGTCVRTLGGVVVSYREGSPPQFITCYSDADCEVTGGTCQKEQGDCNGNGVGDICVCYADYNDDTFIDGDDLNKFKIEYGRVDCHVNPCQADGNGDGFVDGVDFILLKVEYGKIDCPGSS